MRRRNFLASLASAVILPSPLLAQSTSRYTGKLVLEPISGRLMRTNAEFGYIDGRRVRWDVPNGAVVDGASIPRVFWSIIGSPWSGKYTNASVVHDWFCAVRIRPWKETHRMFHEAMLVSGVSRTQAKIMYLAVRYAGPTWDDLTLENSRILTDNGQKRLFAPNNHAATLGFASKEEHDRAKDEIVSSFGAMAARVEAGELSLDGIDDLVEDVGRAETVARMIE